MAAEWGGVFCDVLGVFSDVFSDIYISKMEENIVAPMKPNFYKRYVDDLYTIKEKRTGKSL